MKKYKRNGKIILLDTVSYEFNSIVEHKFHKLYEILWDYLSEAELRINDGEKELDIVREYTKKIRDDPHYTSIYSLLESKGLGFFHLIKKEYRLKLLDFIMEETNNLKEKFFELTRPFVKKFVKEFVFSMISSEKKMFDKFKKITPLIGYKDRLHLLGCIVLYFKFKEKNKLITIDSKILSLKENVENFLLTYNSELSNSIL